MVAGTTVTEQVDRVRVDVVVLVLGRFFLQSVDENLQVRLGDAAEHFIGFCVEEINHVATRV